MGRRPNLWANGLLRAKPGCRQPTISCACKTRGDQQCTSELCHRVWHSFGYTGGVFKARFPGHAIRATIAKCPSGGMAEYLCSPSLSSLAGAQHVPKFDDDLFK